jgi:hypothetical protein
MRRQCKSTHNSLTFLLPRIYQLPFDSLQHLSASAFVTMSLRNDCKATQQTGASKQQNNNTPRNKNPDTPVFSAIIEYEDVQRNVHHMNAPAQKVKAASAGFFFDMLACAKRKYPFDNSNTALRRYVLSKDRNGIFYQEETGHRCIRVDCESRLTYTCDFSDHR